MKLRFIVFLLTFILLGIVRPHSSFAQSASSTPYSLNTNPDVPKNFHVYTQTVILEIASALTCQVAGVDPLNPKGKCLGLDAKTGKIGYVESGGGAIGMMGGLITMTYNIPASTRDYTSNLAENFGFSKKTYAQTAGKEGDYCERNSDCKSEGLFCNNYSDGNGGACQKDPSYKASPVNSSKELYANGIGLASLRPLFRAWETMRNIVYLLFVIIFVILGLGIMMRIKIDPRTVMTIQNQIPKITVALILVTFSYAIAGFLIDMMYLFMYVIFGIGAKAISIQTFNPADLQNQSVINSVGGLGGIGKLAGGASWGVVDIISSLFSAGYAGKIITAIIGGIISAIAAPLTGGLSIFAGIAAGGFLGAASGTIIKIVATAIAFLIFAIALLVALFKLWLTLVKAYIFILIDVILAPFWIAFGLFPGSSIGFGAWLKDLISNLAAFPAVLGMLILAKIIMQAVKDSGSTLFVPPFIGDPGNASAFASLIGVAILLLTPQVVDLVKSAIKAPKSNLLTAVMQSVNAGRGIATPIVSTPLGRWAKYNPQNPAASGGLVRWALSERNNTSNTRAGRARSAVAGLIRLGIGAKPAAGSINERGFLR